MLFLMILDKISILIKKNPNIFTVKRILSFSFGLSEETRKNLFELIKILDSDNQFQEWVRIFYFFLSFFSSTFFLLSHLKVQ